MTEEENNDRVLSSSSWIDLFFSTLCKYDVNPPPIKLSNLFWLLLILVLGGELDRCLEDDMAAAKRPGGSVLLRVFTLMVLSAGDITAEPSGTTGRGRC